MIQITPQTRILVAIEPTDFRRGIDGLAKQCREALRSDPFSGAVFVFSNRRRTSVKILVYDGQGFWLCQKRLSSGRFQFWPKATGGAPAALQAHELHVLLRGGDPATTKASPEWRSVSARGDNPRDRRIQGLRSSTRLATRVAWTSCSSTATAGSPPQRSDSSGS